MLVFTVLIMFVMGCKNQASNSVSQEFHLVKYDAVPVQKTNNTLVLVHYMPWFESKEVDGYWGDHWKMANKNPDIIDTTGRRQIASWFYPLIGPYSSDDPDLIEYHLLLMKLSGIDGAIIDWYGTYHLYDYPKNLENANAFINKTQSAGLSFAIDYEDRTVQNVVSQGIAPDAITAASADMSYIQTNYFSQDNYIQINNHPLLMVFTPVYIQTQSQWTQIFHVFSEKPTFLTLWYESSDAGTNAAGEYAWVYKNNLSDLSNFYYNRKPSLQTAIGSAYPGFKDYYAQGDWGNSLGWAITYNGTQTLSQTLDLAGKVNLPAVQLVTWNDFGEGTMIEPTEEFGYSMLETVQKFTGVPYNGDDLKMAYELYELRKKYASNPDIQPKLDQVFYDIVSLRTDEARKLLDAISNL